MAVTPTASSCLASAHRRPGARSLGFLVADLDGAVAELAAAGIATGEPGGDERERYVHFTAPAGNLYELVERRSQSVR